MLCISNGILLVFGLFGRAGLVIIAVLEEPDLTLELVALYEKNEVRDLLRSQDFPHLTKGVVQELPFLLNLPPELDKVLRRFLEMAARFRDLTKYKQSAANYRQKPAGQLIIVWRPWHRTRAQVLDAVWSVPSRALLHVCQQIRQRRRIRQAPRW